MSLLSKSEIVNIRQSLRDEMEKHLPKWRLLAEYISPNRLKEKGATKVDGSRKDQSIINNQAGRSLRTFVSGMMNGATPRSRPWFNIVSSNPNRKKSSSINRYYSDTEKVINSHFQISNLYRVLPMVYKDVGTFSNSAYAMLPHARYGFYFYPFAIGTYAFACDIEGRTNMFTRDFTLSVRQVVERYASMDGAGNIDWSALPVSIRVLWDSARYLQEVVLTQVIVPNSTYNPTEPSLKASDKKFQSYTYLQDMGSNNVTSQTPIGFRQSYSSAKPEAEFIKIGGYDYFPVITPRWEVEPEGYYGIDGPGDVALSDIMTLQKQEKFRMEGVQKIVRPPMVGHSSLRRHASSILAGGITYVDDRGMQHGFKPAFSVSPQLIELIGAKEEIQGYIKTAFYEDLFRQLSSEQKISHVTAAEINQRTAETMAAMAPVLGQWDHDNSGPLIENAQIILGEAGRLPQKPKDLQNDRLVPEYISVLAQASKASLITTQEKFLTFVAQTSQALGDPTLLKLANGEAQIRTYAENSGLDPKLILDETEYEKILKSSQQAQAIEVQNGQADQEAARAKTLSETKTGTGSALDQMIGT